MTRLLISDIKRLWARRITRYFPLILAALFVGGALIAVIVIESNDTSVDFVEDIAGGTSAAEILGPIADLLPVMAFVIGASYIGADLKSGMVEQILTWEPRRGRFVASRAVSGILSVAIIAMALAIFFIAVLYVLTLSVDGSTDGISRELWTNAAVTVARTGLSSGLFCAFGLAVTLIVSSSVGSITGFVIYWFIIENFLLSAFLPRVAAWLPVVNAGAFSSGNPVQRVEGSVFSESFETVDDHGYLVAGAVLLLYTVVALAVASIVFSRRDVD